MEELAFLHDDLSTLPEFDSGVFVVKWVISHVADRSCHRTSALSFFMQRILAPTLGTTKRDSIKSSTEAAIFTKPQLVQELGMFCRIKEKDQIQY